MTPAPRLAHQLALELLRDVLKPYITSQGLGLVLGAPADLELEPNTIVQPDLFVVPAALGHPPSAGAILMPMTKKANARIMDLDQALCVHK